jgi:hypothetical protein
MKARQLTETINDVLDQSGEPTADHMAVIQNSPEFSQLQDLAGRYHSTLSVFHRHDESVTHQMGLIIQRVLKRELCLEHWQTMARISEIVEEILGNINRDGDVL